MKKYGFQHNKQCGDGGSTIVSRHHAQYWHSTVESWSLLLKPQHTPHTSHPSFSFEWITIERMYHLYHLSPFIYYIWILFAAACTWTQSLPCAMYVNTHMNIHRWQVFDQVFSIPSPNSHVTPSLPTAFSLLYSSSFRSSLRVRHLRLSFGEITWYWGENISCTLTHKCSHEPISGKFRLQLVRLFSSSHFGR